MYEAKESRSPSRDKRLPPYASRKTLKIPNTLNPKKRLIRPIIPALTATLTAR